MWNWFNCYLSGRHDYSVSCEAGAIFLRCPHCGRRSQGWSLDARPDHGFPVRSSGKKANILKMKIVGIEADARPGRVLPFNRAVS